MTKARKAKEERAPLFHVSRRREISWWASFGIRLSAILIALILGMLIITFAYQANPFEAFGQLFVGTFGTERKFWNLLRNTALLLGVGLALVPAFKMKFWNLGGNGQVLMSVLVTALCMRLLGDIPDFPDWAIILIMTPCAILTGAIWAVIPAIFKALFNTNESLFTLMMNYIAIGLVSLCVSILYPHGAGKMPALEHGRLPAIGDSTFIGSKFLLPVIVAILILVFMIYYLNFNKHGYELSVVGGSVNTARYVGIDVKKTIIRTLILSGAICGLIGLLIGGGIDFSVYESSDRNLGFTAIMAVWLAKFNPFMMVLTSLFISFINSGMSQVQTFFSITNTATSDIVIGLVYFLVIGSEFFIEYKVSFSKSISFEDRLTRANPQVKTAYAVLSSYAVSLGLEEKVSFDGSSFSSNGCEVVKILATNSSLGVIYKEGAKKEKKSSPFAQKIKDVIKKMQTFLKLNEAFKAPKRIYKKINSANSLDETKGIIAKLCSDDVTQIKEKEGE